jgi:hypothetical protein
MKDVAGNMRVAAVSMRPAWVGMRPARVSMRPMGGWYEGHNSNDYEMGEK